MTITKPGHATRETQASLVPGLVLATAAAALALVIARLIPGMSPLLVAILLGAVAVNAGWIPYAAWPGLAVASKRLLRLGVALLGTQLVLTDILDLGAGMLIVIVAIVAIGIGATLVMGKWLGIGFTQRLLIACGFSICGAAAVAAVVGVVDADERETATAVGLVVIFGTVMIPVVPALTAVLGLTEEQGGLWAGGSIHEVAQVVAAGGAMGSAALAAAVVVKLGRVLMLGPVLVVIGWQRRRSAEVRATGAKRPPLVPLFVIGFVALAAVRTTGVLPESVVDGAKFGETALLTIAMFALGCGVRIASLRKVGVRPLVLAAASTVAVGATALVGVLLVS